MKEAGSKQYKPYKPYKMFIISCFIWGFAAHGMALTNKYCFHDDQYALFMVSGTVNYGRWMMGVLGKLESILFSGHYSTPLISGLYMLACIAAAGCLIMRMFDIRDRLSCIALAGVMTSLPVITSLFGYMSWGGYHITSLLLAVAGVYVLEMRALDAEKGAPGNVRLQRIFAAVLAVILLACATGIYQAYFPLACSLMLIYYMRKILHTRPAFGKFLAGGLAHIVLAALSLYGYLAAEKLFLWLMHTQIVDYASLDTLGTAGSMLAYPARIPLAYKQFFLPAKDTVYDMYPWTLRAFYYVLLLILAVLTCISVLSAMNGKDEDRRENAPTALDTVNGKNDGKDASEAEKGASISNPANKKSAGAWVTAAECCILAALFPLTVNMIFVLSDLESVHTLMLYPVISVPIAVLVMLKEAGAQPRHKHILYAAAIAVLMLMNLGYCRYDNVCYLKAEFMQQQAISYFTTLATRMQSVDGYVDGMPVIYLNPQSKNAKTLVYDPEFDAVHIIPYGDRTVINSYTWPDFMRRWCGYGPTYLAVPEGFEDRPDVKAMPNYPDDGSIRIIDDVIVVKF